MYGVCTILYIRVHTQSTRVRVLCTVHTVRLPVVRLHADRERSVRVMRTDDRLYAYIRIGYVGLEKETRTTPSPSPFPFPFLGCIVSSVLRESSCDEEI